MRSFEVVVIGAGSGGITVATALAEAGRSVAVVADGFVGGECPYVACMPSKSLLRSARARHEVAGSAVHGATAQPPDLGDPELDWPAAIARRDAVANHRDDTAEARSLTDAGITVVRGHGVLAGPGRVQVGAETLAAAQIVLDTGSVPVHPPVVGLDDVPTWTSDQALSSPDRPARLIVLGAGPIGCELAQVFSTYGSAVTVIDTADRPVPREDPELGALLQDVLGDVTWRFGVSAEKAERGGGGVRLHLDDGTTVAGDRVLIVTGRTPATHELGLGSVGLEPGDHGEVVVDARCRATEGIWAVGDVTGVAPYTHTANHQARVVVDEILGRPGHDQTPDALPRVVFTDPPLAATGLTEAQARDAGHDVVVAEVDLATVSRAGAEGDGALGPKDASGGVLRLIASRSERRLLGAGAIGPGADEWIAEATVAIRARVPLEVMADVVRAFPTYAEAYTAGYRSLLGQLA